MADLSTFLEESLGDCLAWCQSLHLASPSDLEDYRARGSWFRGCEDWARLLDHPEAPATLIRSRILARPALRFLEEDVRACYGAGYRVESWPDSAPGTDAAFTRFLAARRDALAAQDTRLWPMTAEVKQEMARPRALLLTNWQRSVWDGASASASAGWVDLCDIPGWDTWIAVIDIPIPTIEGTLNERCLVSWVPSWAAELIDEAICFNPVECLSWAKLTTTGLGAAGWGVE
jgi:hypothetical protein